MRATLCRERGGRYLAGPPDVHPFGATKLEIAAEFAGEIGAVLSEASAYGDSQHDLDLLQAVGDPVAVMPDPTAARDGARQSLAHHSLHAKPRTCCRNSGSSQISVLAVRQGVGRTLRDCADASRRRCRRIL